MLASQRIGASLLLIMIRRLTRPFWIVLAALFVFEAWLWDRLTAIGRWLRDLLPFEAFKCWLAALVERMPPWCALLLFAIPVAMVQPLKLLALWAMTHGHLVLGAAGFVAIKVVGFGAVAFLFDLTREKLMTFRWFAWLYAHVLWLREKAAAYLAPYKLALRERMSVLRKAAARVLGAGTDGQRSRVARLRARILGK